MDDVRQDVNVSQNTPICIYTHAYSGINAKISMLIGAYKCIYMVSIYICSWIHVYMDVYSHIYPYMLAACTWEVCAIASQRINTQETGVHYTKLTQLWCSTT